MIYGYARVSTRGQEVNGNSLESQVTTLKANGCQEIIEESYTGTKTDRPKFKELIDKLQDGDTLVVTKLDRFARSTIQGCTIVEELINKGVKVNILNMGILDNTPSSTLIRTIFFAFAQFERDMIVERTQEGKAIAKTKEGFKEGRPKEYTDTQINMALNLLKEYSYTEVEKMTKISKATLVRAMRKRKADEANQGAKNPAAFKGYRGYFPTKRHFLQGNMGLAVTHSHHKFTVESRALDTT